MGMVQLIFAVLRYNIFCWYKINKLFIIYPAENVDAMPVLGKCTQGTSFDIPPIKCSHISQFNQVDQIMFVTKPFIDWALTIAG